MILVALLAAANFAGGSITPLVLHDGASVEYERSLGDRIALGVEAAADWTDTRPIAARAGIDPFVLARGDVRAGPRVFLTRPSRPLAFAPRISREGWQLALSFGVERWSGRIRKDGAWRGVAGDWGELEASLGYRVAIDHRFAITPSAGIVATNGGARWRDSVGGEHWLSWSHGVRPTAALSAGVVW